MAMFSIPKPNVTLGEAIQPWSMPSVVVVVTWVGPTREVLADTATIRCVGLAAVVFVLGVDVEYYYNVWCMMYAAEQPHIAEHDGLELMRPRCSSCTVFYERLDIIILSS